MSLIPSVCERPSSRQELHIMKRIAIVVVMLCCAAALFAQTGIGQSRPRRVGQTPSSQPPQGQSSSSQPSSQTNSSENVSRPTRPPVLGGANRDPNEQQKPAAASRKDTGPEEVGEGDIVRIETTLVTIPVSVMDRDGKYIPNLRKEDFRIWEDGVEQQVAYFASTEKPFTVALVLDTSGSVRFRMEEIQDAAIAFVNQLRADDKVIVASFDDRIKIFPATNDRARLRDYIQQTHLGSGTKLYDAVHQVMNELSRVEGRKAIVLFTDGVDTTSKHSTYESTVGEAEELDALIYPVEFDTYSDMAGWPGGGGGSRRGGGYPGGGGGSPRGGGGGGR